MLGCVHVWKLGCVYMYIFVHARIFYLHSLDYVILMCSSSFIQNIVLPFGALVADSCLKLYCSDASLRACFALTRRLAVKHSAAASHFTVDDTLLQPVTSM